MTQELQSRLMSLVDRMELSESFREQARAFVLHKLEERIFWSRLMLAARRMMGGESDHMEELSAALELLILASDILDDLQDQDHPGKVWMQCPPGIAMNIALALLMQFIRILAEQPCAEGCMAAAGRILIRSLNGQMKDLSHTAANFEEYAAMVAQKSGSLFQLTLRLAALSLQLSEADSAKLDELGDCIGLVHQMENDLRDYLDMTGPKSDLRLRRRTLPAIYFLSLKEDKYPVVRAYYNAELSMEDMLAQTGDWRAFVRATGCVDYVRLMQTICRHRIRVLLASMELHAPWGAEFAGLALAETAASLHEDNGVVSQ